MTEFLSAFVIGNLIGIAIGAVAVGVWRMMPNRPETGPSLLDLRTEMRLMISDVDMRQRKMHHETMAAIKQFQP